MHRLAGGPRRRATSATWCRGASLILGVGPLLQIFIYKRFVKRGITSRDCINLTWLGAALLVAYHGWVLAGLPGVT